MTIQELFVISNLALQQSISQISGKQWDLNMPPGMSNKPGTLKQAVYWHTRDDAWVPDVLDGKTIKEVGDIYDDLLNGGDIRGNYTKYNQRANAAVRKFTDLDRITHLSYGDFPAKDYLLHLVIFRAFRSYDIAKLIGGNTTMADGFVQALNDALTPQIDNFRQMGVFPPASQVDDNASPQQKLLAMTGRE